MESKERNKRTEIHISIYMYVSQNLYFTVAWSCNPLFSSDFRPSKSLPTKTYALEIKKKLH